MLREFMEYTPEERASACEHYSEHIYPKCRGQNDPDVCFGCFFLKARLYQRDTKLCLAASPILMLLTCLAAFFLGGNNLVCAAAIAAAGAVPFGWKALGRITPRRFQALPWAGRAVWLCVKLVLSALTGWGAAVVRGCRSVRIAKTLGRIRAIAQIK